MVFCDNCLKDVSLEICDYYMWVPFVLCFHNYLFLLYVLTLKVLSPLLRTLVVLAMITFLKFCLFYLSMCWPVGQ